jgi:putative ABC transport system permease protein
VLVGLAAGLLGSFFLTRFLRNQLFHVSTMDPVSIVAVVLLLSCTAFSACYIPARRAARLDPMSALRHE